jgi:hypothetical protein
MLSSDSKILSGALTLGCSKVMYIIQVIKKSLNNEIFSVCNISVQNKILVQKGAYKDKL